MEDEIEPIDSQTDASEEDTLDEEVEDGAPEEQEETVEQLKEKNAKLFARAKKAEGFVLQDGKWVKPPKPPKAAEPEVKTNASVDPEELKLIARGLSDEAIDQAKAIAKGKDISLPEALKDPLFIAYQESEKEAARKAKAKLGASKGSGEESEANTFDTGISEEGEAKHKELWKKTVGTK